MIRSRSANAGQSNNPWISRQELNRTDANVSVYFIAQNKILYLDQIFDPVFSANGTFQVVNTGLNGPTYLADQYVGVIGCIDQLRIRINNTGFV